MRTASTPSTSSPSIVWPNRASASVSTVLAGVNSVSTTTGSPPGWRTTMSGRSRTAAVPPSTPDCSAATASVSASASRHLGCRNRNWRANSKLNAVSLVLGLRAWDCLIQNLSSGQRERPTGAERQVCIPAITGSSSTTEASEAKGGPKPSRQFRIRCNGQCSTSGAKATASLMRLARGRSGCHPAL